MYGPGSSKNTESTGLIGSFLAKHTHIIYFYPHVDFATKGYKRGGVLEQFVKEANFFLKKTKRAFWIQN